MCREKNEGCQGCSSDLGTFPHRIPLTVTTVKFPAPVFTTKGRVATAPFADMSVKTALLGAGPVKVARIENKVTLARLKVVFPSEDGRFSPGQTLLVRSSLYTAMWAKEIQEHEGVQFILVPDDKVEVVVNGD
jgi:hypothetical protein